LTSQRSNPETRVAWERARQAAAAVGLTESAYFRADLSIAFARWNETVLRLSLDNSRNAPVSQIAVEVQHLE
jgi:hypothetical protein